MTQNSVRLAAQVRRYRRKKSGFCKACGAPLKPGAEFCTACGTKVTTETQQESEKETIQQPDDTAASISRETETTEPPKPATQQKKNLPVIIGVAVVVCIGIVAAVLKSTVFSTPSNAKTAEEIPDTTVQQETEAIKEVDSEQIDSSDADLFADGTVSLQGTVKISTDNRLFLDWDKPMSILLKEGDEEFVRISAVSSAYLQNEDVDSSLWNELPLKQEVLITGTLELDGSQLILHAEQMTDPNGNAIVTEAEEAVSEEILPESDSRLLTQQDVAGLSLQEINYAKNEIYARHGRKFASNELQNYFNEKSWYHGTVDAADFKESVLSDVEKKNAEFLAEVEFSIAPNGYQLDQ